MCGWGFLKENEQDWNYDSCFSTREKHNLNVTNITNFLLIILDLFKSIIL